MAQLQITYFGNEILRSPSRVISATEVKSLKFQKFITSITEFILSKDYGIGVAAPQLGLDLSLAVISIRPTKSRPNVEEYFSVIINPKYTGIGYRKQLWEGCLSSGKAHNSLFAKVPRYKKIQAIWMDEKGEKHSELLEGLPAHVFQHETDHLNGILFVDKVKDTTTYMAESEYRKMVAKNRAKTSTR